MLFRSGAAAADNEMAGRRFKKFSKLELVLIVLLLVLFIIAVVLIVLLANSTPENGNKSL